MFGRRRRRLFLVVGAVVVLLVLGRWTASFAAGRLWEAGVSEPAALVGTRFALLAAGLELLGLVVAIGWFVGHLVWATRSVVLQRGELPERLRQVSERTVYFVAVALGVLFGIAVGSGTGTWVWAVLLDSTDLRFGVPDTLLRADLGTFAARLPLWELLFDRAVALVVPALVGVALISLMGGTIKLVDRRVFLARAARWHIALLLVLAALLIGWSQAMVPFRLAADQSTTLATSEFLLRTTVSQVIVLLAATAAVLSFLWAMKFRFVVAAGGWVGLGLGMLGGAILVQSRTTGAPLPPMALGPVRGTDSVAFGIRLAPGSTPAPVDSFLPSLWDREVVARLTSTDSIVVADAWPGTVTAGGKLVRAWFVLRVPPSGDPTVIAIADDQTGPVGGVASLRWGEDTFSPGIVPFLTLSRHYAWPGAPEFDLDPAAAGVELSTAPRRIALAWALQHGDLLRAGPNQRIAWRLDPVRRLAAIAPFADWGRPRVVVIDRDLYWVSDGFFSLTHFPSSTTVPWADRAVGYARAGLIGAVRARGGEARIYLRPDADSLATAWARLAEPLIEPAANIPSAIAAAGTVPAPAASATALVLADSAWLGQRVATVGRIGYPVGELPNLGSETDPHRIPFLSPDGQRVAGLLRIPGGSGAAFLAFDSAKAVGTPRDLQQRWDGFPFFQRLRDSVRAAGSEFHPGVIRFAALADTVVAYQPSYALGPGGRGGLVLVNLALGPKLGAGRTFEEAWRNLRGEVPPVPVGGGLESRLFDARLWLERADSALRRGDLEEFGRAFAYLRELLKPIRTP